MGDWMYAQEIQHREAISSVEAGLIDPPSVPETCPSCGHSTELYDEEGLCIRCGNSVTDTEEPDNPNDEHDSVRDHERAEAQDETDKALYEAGL